jgi:hypothetical protein
MARKWAVELASLKANKAEFSKISSTIDRTQQGYRSIVDRLHEAFKAAAILVRYKAMTNASAGGAPQRIHSSTKAAIFAYLKLDASSNPKRKGSPLIGVRTGKFHNDERLWKTWGVGSARRKDGSIAKNGLSMSLGAMFERGTRRGGKRTIRPIRFFRNAVFSSKPRIYSILADAYRRAIQQLNK